MSFRPFNDIFSDNTPTQESESATQTSQPLNVTVIKAEPDNSNRITYLFENNLLIPESLFGCWFYYEQLELSIRSQRPKMRPYVTVGARALIDGFHNVKGLLMDSYSTNLFIGYAHVTVSKEPDVPCHEFDRDVISVIASNFGAWMEDVYVAYEPEAQA